MAGPISWRRASRRWPARNDHDEPADQHRDAAGKIVEGRVAGQTGKGRAVVTGLRHIGIEDLGKAVRPRIGD